MSTDNKSLNAVTKLNELTQDRSLTWQRVNETSDIVAGTDNVVDVAFYTEIDGKRLRLYEMKYVEYPGSHWESTPILEIVDQDGKSVWKFPTFPPTWHLLQTVRFQTSGAEDFIDHLLTLVPITDNDVFDAFSKLPYLKKPEIENIATECRRWLMARGVTTRKRLDQLVEAKDMLAWLEDTYVKELLRSPESPLDPLAVAVWGGLLFSRGATDAIKNVIVKQIRRSPEYATKHPPKH